jgi:plastocyanin
VVRTVLVLVVAFTLVGSAAARPAANTVLIATVGTNDGFDIGLTDVNGAPVTWIPPGTYDFLVRDHSAFHNFHLASNEDTTVDFRTELAFVGEMTFTATLRDETRYAYACEPHWTTMNGSFFVSSRPVPPPPPVPVPIPTLRGGVTAAGRPFLAKRSVKAGKYRVVVGDRSRKANFHLVGYGVDRQTGKRFRGNKAWTVRLTRGAYRFGSDPRLTGTLRVR